MKYRNTVTGAVIDVTSKLSGGNWQAIEPAEAPKVAPVQPKGRSVKKNVKSSDD